MSAPVLSTTVMSSGIVAVAYIVAALLFVLSLAGLSKHETAKTGNTYGIVGMAVALVATIWVVFDNRGYAVGWQAALVFLPMIVGGAIGVWRALRVEMTGMPQLIAMLHSVLFTMESGSDGWRRYVALILDAITASDREPLPPAAALHLAPPSSSWM